MKSALSYCFLLLCFLVFTYQPGLAQSNATIPTATASAEQRPAIQATPGQALPQPPPRAGGEREKGALLPTPNFTTERVMTLLEAVRAKAMSKQERVMPRMQSSSANRSPAQADTATEADTCYEWLSNNGFEYDDVWQGAPAANTGYSSSYYYSGAYSFFLDTFRIETDASIFGQYVDPIPGNASSVGIDYYAVKAVGDPGEEIYFAIYNGENDTLLYYEELTDLFANNNTNEWYYFWDDALPIADFANQSLFIGFVLFRESGGGDDYYSDYYFDDMSLTVCLPAATPTPTPTRPTPTPTRPTPTPTRPTPTPTRPTPTPTRPTPTPTRPTPTPTRPTPTPTRPTPTPTRPTPTPPPAVADAFEPDNSCAIAKALPVDGVQQTHTFHVAAEQDWVQFSAVADIEYRIEVQIPADSPADVDLELYDTCDSLPEPWTASFTPGVRLDFTAEQSGPIFLKFKNNPDNRAGSNVAYTIAVRPLTTQQPGALIIVAGRLKLADPLQPNIHNVTDAVHALFQANGYTNDNILYLATDSERPGYDLSATKANLRNALTTWAAARVDGQRALTLYLMDHGGPNAFYLDEVNQERVTPAELDSWLDELEASRPGVRINVIIEACNAGSFATGATRISAPGRVIITSTSADSLAYASATGAHFSDHLLTALRQGQSLLGSFGEARAAVSKIVNLQQPWLDGDGDGIPNESADNAAAAQRGFGAGALDETTWPPFIAAAVPPTTIRDRSGTISAEVRDDKAVRRVWAVIYPPSYTPPTSQNELAPETLPTIVLQAQGENRYAALYTGFAESGAYRVVIHAEDGDGLEARPATLTVDTGVRLYLPTIMR